MANPNGTPKNKVDPSYDSAKDLFYFMVPQTNGKPPIKVYQSPNHYQGQNQGSGHGMDVSPNDGFTRTSNVFNPITGDVDQGGFFASPAMMALVVAGTFAGAQGIAHAASGTGTTATIGGAGPTTGLSGGGAAVSTAAGSGIGRDFLRYVLPTAGGLIQSYFQNSANTDATALSQKNLEAALAYQKEIDAYNRKRQEGLDQQERDRYGDTQDKYRANVEREAGRYGDYSNNIAPYIAGGVQASGRMLKLLGLDPSSATSWQPNARPSRGGPGETLGDPKLSASKLSDADKDKIDALLKTSNSSDDADYWYGVAAQHGGFDKTGADWLQKRISIGDGSGKGYTAPPPRATAPPVTPTTPPPTTPTTPPPTSTPSPTEPPADPTLDARYASPRVGGSDPNATPTPPASSDGHGTIYHPPQPEGTPLFQDGGDLSGPTITVQAPDGETQERPATELDHWRKVPGAVILPPKNMGDPNMIQTQRYA